MYITNITFKKDVTFESTREDHKRNFKVKKRTYTENNLRKPIYGENGRRVGYEKRKVVSKTFKIFEAGLSIDFKPITVIVGDNGCGKTSLLKYLKPPEFTKMYQFSFSDKTPEELYKEDFLKWQNDEEKTVKFVAFPKYFIIENNIHKNSFLSSIGQGKTTLSGEEILMKWDMANDSNGETTIDFINSLKSIEDSLIVLDEPETSLSIKTQLKMRKIIKELSKKNQLILVTHSPIFMELSKEVYNFEAKQWEVTENYIKSQYS